MFDDANALPWTRGGNPQPRSGKRGSPAWALAPPLPFDVQSEHNLAVDQQSKAPGASNSYGAFYADPAYYAHSALNLTQFANSVEQREAFAKEQHKLELLRQIEDNKRRKMLEKQREWEMEERERVKNELYQQRVRLEIEEEKRKEREKEQIAQRKAERIAAAQKAAAALLEQQQQQQQQQQQKARQRAEKLRQANDDLSAFNEERSNNDGNQPQYATKAEDGAAATAPPEWWEKSSRFVDRLQSPVIPALRDAAQAARQSSPVIPALRAARKASRARPGANDNDDDRADINYTDENFQNDVSQKPQPRQATRPRHAGKYHDNFGDENDISEIAEVLPNNKARPLDLTYSKYDDSASMRDTVASFAGSAPSRSSSHFSASPPPPETRRRARQRSETVASRRTQPASQRRRHGFDENAADDEAAATADRSSTDVSDGRQRMRARSYSRSNRRSYRSSVEEAADARRRKFSDSRSDSAESRLADSPAMRRLNGTQRSLRRENKRVRAALRTNSYGAHIFDT